MTNNSQSIIYELLDQLIVFDFRAKEQILAKIKLVPSEKAKEVITLLKKAVELQKEAIKEKLKVDSQFFHKIADERKKIARGLIAMHDEKLKKRDDNKMQIIMNKIKSL